MDMKLFSLVPRAFKGKALGTRLETFDLLLTRTTSLHFQGTEKSVASGGSAILFRERVVASNSLDERNTLWR